MLPACCSANRSTFFRRLSKCTWTAKNAIISEPCSYYNSASVPKWPQKKSQSIKFKKKKFPGGACPQIPLVLHAYACIHTHYTPLLKILAMGLATICAYTHCYGLTTFMDASDATVHILASSCHSSVNEYSK